MSRNMRKLRVILHNATIDRPLRSNLQKKIAKNIFLPHLKCKTCSEGDI